MTMYPDAFQADALTSHNGGYHPYAYDSQQRSRHGDISMARADQGYGPTAVMSESTDYMPSNSYYAPPQAPRLSAAAARASSMAAMYYNPTLHPSHPLNISVGAGNPWASTYRADNFGQYPNHAPAYHHQHIEDQLVAQNKRGYGNLAGYSAAATAYGQEQHQPEQQSAHRYSYPHDQSQRNWNQHLPLPPPRPLSNMTWREEYDQHNMAVYRRNQSDATPTGFPSLDQDQRGQSYFDHSGQLPLNAENAVSTHTHTLSLPGPSYVQNGVGGWTAVSNGNGWDSRRTSWNQAETSGDSHTDWRAQSGWPSGNDTSLWHRDHEDGMSRAQEGWAAPAQNQPVPLAMQHQTSTAPAAAYHPQYNVYNSVHEACAAPHDNAAKNNEVEADVVKRPDLVEQPKAAPAPPSPDTLDKSAVPMSSVGAEIIWSACVIFSEPEVLASCTRHLRGEGRGRAPSSTFAHSPSSDWGKKTMQLNGDHDRNYRGTSRSQTLQRTTVRTAGEAATSSEESSASSSEPGTPPSSFPLYMYDDAQGLDNKRKSYSTSNVMQGLEASRGEGHFARDNSLPALERRRTHDRVHQASSSVLSLVSPDCQWSMYENKFPSLSQSLRHAAKISHGGPHCTDHRMRSTSVTGLSPRSDEVHSLNGASAVGSEPSPAFRRFAHQVLAQTLVSPTAFILAIMYSLRVPHLAVQTNGDGTAELDAEAREIFAQPPSAAPFKLFTLGLMIANKHLDDNTFLNKTWNEVTGISLSEINRMERWYLEKCSYEIVVPEESWATFLENLAARTESKLSNHNEGKRHRVSAKTHSSMSQDISPHHSSNFKALGGLTHEEAIKRMLLSVEEALVVLGRLAPFDLTRQIQSASPSFGSEHRRLTSPSTNISAITHSGNALQSLHHDCRSAPALDQYHDVGSDADVFGDEVGPYRPQGKSVRSQLAHERRSLDPFFQRSQSENTASLSWYQQQARPQLEDLRKGSETGAPLAPSVLLDLLNRGQHLAHSAQY